MRYSITFEKNNTKRDLHYTSKTTLTDRLIKRAIIKFKETGISFKETELGSETQLIVYETNNEELESNLKRALDINYRQRILDRMSTKDQQNNGVSSDIKTNINAFQIEEYNLRKHLEIRTEEKMPEEGDVLNVVDRAEIIAQRIIVELLNN